MQKMRWKFIGRWIRENSLEQQCWTQNVSVRKNLQCKKELWRRKCRQKKVMCRLISDLCWEMLRNANRLKNYVTVKSVLHRIACFIKASVCSISTRITIQDELISVRQVCVNVFCSWKENRVSCRTNAFRYKRCLKKSSAF